jgi:hypothetical protein
VVVVVVVVVAEMYFLLQEIITVTEKMFMKPTIVGKVFKKIVYHFSLKPHKRFSC